MWNKECTQDCFLKKQSKLNLQNSYYTRLLLHSHLQEADLAIAPLTLTAAREKAVAMTKPFMQTGISILLRKDISEDTGLFDFLTPFSPETWVGILIAYLGTAACIFLVTRFVIKFIIMTILVSYGRF